MTALPLLKFEEAQRVGEQLHDRWQSMAGSVPLDREDMAWADIVQFVMRSAAQTVLDREALLKAKEGRRG